MGSTTIIISSAEISCVSAKAGAISIMNIAEKVNIKAK